MKLKNLYIKNFMPFDEASIDLDNQGIVGVFGNNETSQGFSSNGSGKSSLWDALVWVIYGKTIRGLSGDEVIRKGQTKASVKLEAALEDGTRVYIGRSRGKSTQLTFIVGNQPANGSTASQTQEKITSIMGMDYQTFLTSVFFGQDCSRFAQATDAEQKAILDKILNLEVYKRALENAKNATSETQNALVGVVAHIERLRSENQLNKGYIQQETTNLQAFETDKANRLGQINVKIGELIFDCEKYKAESIEAANQLKEAEADSGLFTSEPARTVEDPRPAIQRLERENKALEAKYERLKANLCHTCGQQVDKEKAEALGLEIIGQVATNDGQLADLRAKISIFETETRARDEWKAMRDEYIVLIGDLKAKAKTSESEWNRYSRELSATQARFEVEKAKTSDVFSLRIKDLEAKIQANEAMIYEKEGEVQKLKGKLDIYSFWEKGFGQSGIRSFLLDGVMATLTNSANHYAEIMLGGSIRIEFTNQSELKSGEVRERISVKAINRDGADIYAGNSAGERQRIDFIISLALHDLARQRNNNSYNLLVLDEAFERMDAAGTERVLDLLRSLQKGDSRKSVFVVSHLDSLTSQFSKRLVVTKRNGISSVKALGAQNCGLEQQTSQARV